MWTTWRHYCESTTHNAGFQEKDKSLFKKKWNWECALTEVNLNVRFASAGPSLSEYRRLEVGIRKCLSWIHRIRSFLMCLKTIKISKTLDEIANTQCGPEIFCISEVITNIPWYHFSRIDIFRGIRKISVDISSEASFTQSDGSFIWSRDRFFRHRATNVSID